MMAAFSSRKPLFEEKTCLVREFSSKYPFFEEKTFLSKEFSSKHPLFEENMDSLSEFAENRWDSTVSGLPQSRSIKANGMIMHKKTGSKLLLTRPL